MFLYMSAVAALYGCNSGNSEKSDASGQKDKGNIGKVIYGTLPDGAEADLYTLRNANGMTIRITNYGGIITSWTAPDKTGKYEDITLGCDSLSDYLKGVPYFGALVGRYGNRIANGKFTLNGQAYTLAQNNGPNSLHGGIKGFDKVLWQAIAVDGEEPQLKLRYVSADEEEGFPGTLTTDVTYTLQKDNALSIDYTATTDKPTVVNLTNHAYFNLSGDMNKTVLDHEVAIKADRFLPVDETLIPTGELKPVAGTVFDFTKFKKISEGINADDQQIKFGGGYDHCWVFADNSNSLKEVASVFEPGSGRVMTVSTTEPAIQFYTGNFLDGTVTGKGGVSYAHRTGFCLETEHYPDSPNQPKFPSTVLQPGETYRTTTVYKFSVKQD
ncbi:MAG: galactose mutarotase [Chitinophagaceae bacterium]|nr:galactose mutarotase [Chitinophagaceae bacterium]MCW5928326.1 galactose mutarotase [Chitinophagaceae bacterium]